MPGRLVFYATRSLLAGALLFCALWATASLSFPFGWDHGIMASVGDVILAGGMPYRDAWDIKGPLAHLWFAAAQLLFGRGQIGVRVFDLLLLVWTAIVLARAGARLTRPSLAPWIAVGLVLSYGSLTFFYTAQPDGAVALLLALAFAPLLPAPRLGQTVIAGLVVGLSALVKPIYLVFLALPLLVAARAPGEPPRRRAGYVGLVIAAAALPVLVVLAWFVWRGALDSLIEVLVRYNVQDYSGVTQLAVRTRLRGYAEYLWSGPRAPALAFLVFGAVVAWRRSRYAGGLIIGWCLAGLALVGLQGKFFPYHWILVFPPAILLVGMAIDALGDPPRMPDGRRRTAHAILGYAAAVAIAGPLVMQPALDIANWLRFVTGADTAADYHARFTLGGYSAADQVAAAEYIRIHTAPTDRVGILGYEAPVIYLAGRTNATRFSYALPLVGWRSSQAVRDRYRREFLNALAGPTEPKYVVVGILLVGSTTEVFPEFADYLSRDYTLERSFGPIGLYRRLR